MNFKTYRNIKDKAEQAGHTLVELVFTLLFFIATGGYIANIVKIVIHINDVFTLLLGLRCLGVLFPPLGVLLGFF